jgi:hypothetical protein
MREGAKAEFKGILIGDSARVSSVVGKFRGKINHEKFLRVEGGLQNEGQRKFPSKPSASAPQR